MFPRNGKHSINRTALPKRTSPSPPCHSMWKSAWAIKQNPRFCLYLNFPLVFFSQTTWRRAEPVSVDREWHMRIAGSDAVLVLFVLFFCKQQFFLQHASKNASTEPGNKRLHQGFFHSCSLDCYPSQLWSWPVRHDLFFPKGTLETPETYSVSFSKHQPHLLNTPCAWSYVLIVWCMALCMWTRGSHHKQLHLQGERVPPASLSMLICKWESTCLCLKT